MVSKPVQQPVEMVVISKDQMSLNQSLPVTATVPALMPKPLVLAPSRHAITAHTDWGFTAWILSCSGEVEEEQCAYIVVNKINKAAPMLYSPEKLMVFTPLVSLSAFPMQSPTLPSLAGAEREICHAWKWQWNNVPTTLLLKKHPFSLDDLLQWHNTLSPKAQQAHLPFIKRHYQQWNSLGMKWLLVKKKQEHPGTCLHCWQPCC